MITEVSAGSADGEGSNAPAALPITATERSARWGHQGGILALEGPVELIDTIERSLFETGVITQRIDTAGQAFAHQPGLIDLLTHLQAQAGLLVLAATANESDQLTAGIAGRQIVLDDGNRAAAVAAVHQLLHQARILHDTERLGL
jgi:hypothetical protein